MIELENDSDSMQIINIEDDSIQNRKKDPPRVLRLFDLSLTEFIVILISAVMVFVFYIIYIGKTELIDYDEGVYLVSNLLFRDGKQLYSQIFISQTPFLFEFVRITTSYIPDLLVAGRVTVVLLSIIGFIATALCCLTITKNKLRNSKSHFLSETKAWLIIPISMILLGFFSEYWIDHARIIMPNVPQASFSILSLWFFYQSIKCDGFSVWEFLTGVSLSIGILFKLFGVIPVPFIFFYYIFSKKKKQKVLPFLLGLILPIFVIFKYDLSDFLDQVFFFHIQKDRNIGSLLNGFKDLLDWLRTDIILFALVVIVIIPIINRRNRFEIIALIWTFYNLLVLLLYSPIYEQHFVHVIPSMAMLASLSLFSIIKYIERKLLTLVKKITEKNKLVKVLFLKINKFLSKFYRNDFSNVIALTVLIFSITSPVYFTQIDTSDSNEMYLKTAELIQTLIDPDEFFLTDSPSIAYYSDRLIIPQLVDISNQRISSGNLEPAFLISLAQQYNISVVLYYAKRLMKINEWNDFIFDEFEFSYYFNSTLDSWATTTMEMTIDPQIENLQVWIRNI